MIDLSFTRDPEWIEQREAIWKPREASLKEDFRKKVVEEIKQYFFTGELLKGSTLDDAAKFGYFPLQNPQGWDYVFQHLVKDAKVYEKELYFSLSDPGDLRILTQEQELDLWDYFLGDGLYQPIVKSRVPVGKLQQCLEIHLNHARLTGDIFGGLFGWLRFAEYGNKPKWLIKKDYAFSLLPYVKDDYISNSQPSSQEYRASHMLTRIMQFSIDFKPKSRVDDPEHNREKFLELFAHELNTTEALPECLKQRWEQVKAGVENF